MPRPLYFFQAGGSHPFRRDGELARPLPPRRGVGKRAGEAACALGRFGKLARPLRLLRVVAPAPIRLAASRGDTAERDCERL